MHVSLYVGWTNNLSDCKLCQPLYFSLSLSFVCLTCYVSVFIYFFIAENDRCLDVVL